MRFTGKQTHTHSYNEHMHTRLAYAPFWPRRKSTENAGTNPCGLGAFYSLALNYNHLPFATASASATNAKFLQRDKKFQHTPHTHTRLFFRLECWLICYSTTAFKLSTCSHGRWLSLFFRFNATKST